MKGLTPSLDWEVEKEEIQIKYEEIESDFDVETSSSTSSDRIVFYRIIVIIPLSMLLYIILFSDNSTFSFHIFKDFLIKNKEGRKCILRKTYPLYSCSLCSFHLSSDRTLTRLFLNIPNVIYYSAFVLVFCNFTSLSFSFKRLLC